MSAFLTKLELECVGDRRWKVTSAFAYRSDVAQTTIIVPAGFETDLLSTWSLPFASEMFDGTDSEPAVIHDYLYSSHQFSREVADDVLYEACRVTGTPAWKAWIIWAGVRIGGASHYDPPIAEAS